jgi:hypothetical protein
VLFSTPPVRAVGLRRRPALSSIRRIGVRGNDKIQYIQWLSARLPESFSTLLLQWPLANLLEGLQLGFFNSFQLGFLKDFQLGFFKGFQLGFLQGF